MINSLGPFGASNCLAARNRSINRAGVSPGQLDWPGKRLKLRGNQSIGLANQNNNNNNINGDLIIQVELNIQNKANKSSPAKESRPQQQQQRHGHKLDRREQEH